MKEMFFGLGRTWALAVVVIVGATVMFGIGKVDAGQWQEIIQWVFGLAAAKSAVVGVAGKIKSKE